MEFLIVEDPVQDRVEEPVVNTRTEVLKRKYEEELTRQENDMTGSIDPGGSIQRRQVWRLERAIDRCDALSALKKMLDDIVMKYEPVDDLVPRNRYESIAGLGRYLEEFLANPNQVTGRRLSSLLLYIVRLDPMKEWYSV